MRLEELSYANENQPRLKRWLIRSIEGLSGRGKYLVLYERWRNTAVPSGVRVFASMLDLLSIRLDTGDTWPPAGLPEGPLVIIANHPYGIGDGIAILAMAEQLGRPFRVLINNELMKIREMAEYGLPVSFEETREAMQMNMETRKEAVRLLKTGTTIVVFPAGGVATAPKGFGRAVDLPWKMFVARLIQSANAHVIPIHFDGQNGRLFHLASRVSLTLRLSLLIREFRKLTGTVIKARAGAVLDATHLSGITDRKLLLELLHTAVFALRPAEKPRRRLIAH